MAGRISEDFINEVRSSVNIVDVISQYVSLEKKGKDYLGLCPFHQEKTPSFTVNEEKQFFKCFGCGKGGNVFKFLMYKDNLTFPESVQEVAEFAHIPMPNNYSKTAVKANPLIELHREAVNFYHRVLLSTKAGERGMQYAEKRKLDQDTLEHFQIGYAPKQDNLLLTYLRGKKFDDDLLAKSGLFVQSKDGRLFDRFRDRLMFPLANENGQVIGFSGRRISDDKTEAKYMNSPETEIFTKSKVLFHFAEAKKAAREEGHLVLYEGYMDVISAYKAGVKSGIASMGTSLTDQQVYMLRRVTSEIIINYDGDDPGVHAEERAARMFEKAGGFKLGIVVLPEKLDPDEYVKKFGAEKYQKEIQGALSPIDFFLQRIAKKFNLNNDREKVTFLDEAVKEIARVSNPVEQDLYLEKLAREQNVSKDSLKANLLRERRRQNRARRHQGKAITEKTDLPESTAIPTITTEDPAQIRLLYLFMHSEEARNYMLENKFLFPGDKYAEIANLWLKFIETHEKTDTNSFSDFIPDQLQGIIVNAEMTKMPPDSSPREIIEIVESLRRRSIDSQLKQLQSQIMDAQRRQDNDTIIKLTQRILELKRTRDKKEAF
ncbi:MULTISPECIES: DNA primase [Lactobacillus]|uniref:DNA primase n=1 Tax=Lactobacillus xujianguonis TaxID=2495899 RepID=A0A437SXQ9_9LACO|nr:MULTISPECIES: DNA primase [Lactobacillus]RVU71705.1 DNA primase [Lactobacillus xujianguonis]RVU77535.1 DNA primase [Lactobacillus xujianguonis]